MNINPPDSSEDTYTITCIGTAQWFDGRFTPLVVIHSAWERDPQVFQHSAMEFPHFVYLCWYGPSYWANISNGTSGTNSQKQKDVQSTAEISGLDAWGGTNIQVRFPPEL